MTLSKLWTSFILIAILFALGRAIFVSGEKDIFSRMVVGKSGDAYDEQIVDSNTLDQPVIAEIAEKGSAVVNGVSVKKTEGHYVRYRQQQSDGILQTTKTAVEICLGLIGIMALFMGIMQIAEDAGGIRVLSKIIGPFFERLFPEVPKGHPAFGLMMLNFSANMLGLDNAATPFGLKAMESLQELNPKKDTATHAQIMFLCLHAAGLTLIPVSIIAIRANMGAHDPTDIFLPCMITTFVATMAAMILVAIRQKINLFQPVIVAWVGGISAVIAVLIVLLNRLGKTEMEQVSSMISSGLILLIIFVIVLGGWYKKVDVFGSFVKGAAGGFTTSVKIIPYLVGMLIAISLLRTSGAFDIVIQAFKYVFEILHLNTGIADGMPTALIKPLSGSGARGMMVDTIRQFGADSFPGRLSAVFQGSSDTTFYVIAVYFGAVSVSKVRYTAGIMLLADLVGIITAIIVTNFWAW